MSALTDGDRRWLIEVIDKVVREDFMPAARREMREAIERDLAPIIDAIATQVLHREAERRVREYVNAALADTFIAEVKVARR